MRGVNWALAVSFAFAGVLVLKWAVEGLWPHVVAWMDGLPQTFNGVSTWVLCTATVGGLVLVVTGLTLVP